MKLQKIIQAAAFAGALALSAPAALAADPPGNLVQCPYGTDPAKEAGSCDRMGPEDMRENGFRMDFEVWHPNPTKGSSYGEFGNRITMTRACREGGMILVRAKALESRGVRCGCPDETHQWVQFAITPYCQVRDEYRDAAERGELASIAIPGWDEWRREAEVEEAAWARGAEANSDSDLSDCSPQGGSANAQATRDLLVWAAVPDQEGAAQVCALLRRGADPNGTAGDSYRAAPLHKTVRDNAVENVRLLLEAGADPNKQNKNGMTPLDRAEKLNRPDIANLLKEHGGECNAKSGGLCN